MADFLLFRLEAQLAAFGELAVGERRGSARRPTRSAIAGLLAAALGLSRTDPGLEALADGIRLAVRTDGIGSPLADFHTAQTPPQRRGRRYATRKDELAVKTELGTIVSRRDYWTDVVHTVLIAPRPGVAYTLEAIAAALDRPAFPLFLGRRSCPLGAPVAARVLQAATLGQAFADYDAWQGQQRKAADLPCLVAGQEVALDVDLMDDAGAGLNASLRVIRRDRLASRARWQFDLREELVLPFAALVRAVGLPAVAPAALSGGGR